jgi:hypothetical protein
VNNFNPTWIERFNSRVLQWARACFEEELQSDFKRVCTFDSAANREIISLLRSQSADDLKILQYVLPTGVFSESPDAINRRKQLGPRERNAVEKLRSDFDQECRKHFQEHVARIARKDDKTVKEQFNLASREGNNIIKNIASELKCEVGSGARGEWGLIFLSSMLRTTVSLDLARNMELGYRVGVFDLSSSRSIRFHDTYLGLLGFGIGQWDVGTADKFPEKIHTAIKFALWHVSEYDKMLAACRRELG